MTPLMLFTRQFKRELLLQIRQYRNLLNACLFFLMVLIVFSMTIKPDETLMQTIAPGLVWVAVLLTALLSSERLFQQDYEYGVVEQWLCSGQPLALIVFAKVLAHWIMNLIPILLLSPVVLLFFSFSLWGVQVLILSLLCGTPAVLFLCALASAFGVGVSQRGALMGMILLPLTLPILIFGSGVVSIGMQGIPVSPYIAILSAISLLGVVFLPFAIAGVVKVSQVD